MTYALTERPERLFTGLAAMCGLVYVFLMPPGQTPDEAFHFHRAWHVSEGHLFPQVTGEWGGGEVPSSLLRVTGDFGNLPLQPDQQTRVSKFGPLLNLPLRPEDRQTVPFGGAAYYSFVPYLPQALGIAAAREMGAGPLPLFYAGRLANLALAVVLVFWAIRLTPCFKLVLGLVSLIPMTVHQFGSFSPDASTIGTAFLLTALFLRLALAPAGQATASGLAALFSVATWLTLCKFPYALLALLWFAVPVERLGSRRRHAFLGAALLLVTFGLAVGQTQLRKFTPGTMPAPILTGPTSLDAQIEFIRTHPLGYARILSATIAEHGKIWIDQLSMLGWLDTTLNPLAMHVFWTFMVVLALGDRAGPLPPVRLRLVGLGTALLCLVVILTSCYVFGCPVRHKLIIGPQGRYFLPFLPLLLLPFYNRTVEVRVNRGLLFAWTVAAGAAIQVVAFAGITRRYYFEPDAQRWFAPLGLAAAALVLGVVAAWAARRRESVVVQTADRMFEDRGDRRRLLESTASEAPSEAPFSV